MKKLAFVLLLLFPSCVFATTGVVGHVQNLGTGNLSSNAFVRFWLRGCAGNQPRIAGTAVIGPSSGGVFYFDFPVSASGTISGTLYSTRDSTGLLGGDIECGGSTTAVWYGMQVFQNGKGGPEVPIHAKNTINIDISTVTPISTTPVGTAGTSGNGQGISCSAGAIAIPYFNGALTLCDPNLTDDGAGTFGANAISAAAGVVAGTTVSAGTSVTTPTVITTGPGFTQVFQSQAAPDATFRANNMATGQMVWYGNSATQLWDCMKKDGTSCTPGGAAFSGITNGTNSNTGTFISTGNSWDFTGTTIFKLRVTAGCTSTVVGDLCYDSTSKMWHIWQNGADNFLITGLASGTYTDQDCVKFTKSGGILNVADSGGACGASGSASPMVFSSAAGLSSTITQFIGVGNIATSDAAAQVPVPRSGTVSNLQCRSTNALSSSQTETFTLRKGAASIGAITSSSQTLTCALNSTNTNGCSDGTHSFSVAAGDVLDIQSVPANSPAPGIVNCSVQLQ
jgi:hypothetical protein